MKKKMKKELNEIQTWCQGHFVDQKIFNNWTEDEKRRADMQESFFVRPYPTGNKVCRVTDPDMAKWIAERLNLASKLEQERSGKNACNFNVNDVSAIKY